MDGVVHTRPAFVCLCSDGLCAARWGEAHGRAQRMKTLPTLQTHAACLRSVEAAAVVGTYTQRHTTSVRRAFVYTVELVLFCSGLWWAEEESLQCWGGDWNCMFEKPNVELLLSSHACFSRSTIPWYTSHNNSRYDVPLPMDTHCLHFSSHERDASTASFSKPSAPSGHRRALRLLVLMHSMLAGGQYDAARTYGAVLHWVCGTQPAVVPHTTQWLCEYNGFWWNVRGIVVPPGTVRNWISFSFECVYC